jgi:hypothetical protein
LKRLARYCGSRSRVPIVGEPTWCRVTDEHGMHGRLFLQVVTKIAVRSFGNFDLVTGLKRHRFLPRHMENYRHDHY